MKHLSLEWCLTGRQIAFPRTHDLSVLLSLTVPLYPLSPSSPVQNVRGLDVQGMKKHNASKKEVIMAALVLKTFPDELHRRLKLHAKLNRRSMANQAILLLQESLDAQTVANRTCFVTPPFKGRRPLTDAILDEARKARP